MANESSNRLKLIAVCGVVFLLGTLALLTVTKLQQEKAIAPTAPTQQKAFEGSPVPACQLDFALAQPSPCVTTSKRVSPLPECQTAQVTLDVVSTCPPSVTRLPVDVVLAFDSSESMGSTTRGVPLNYAKTAAAQFVDQLDPTTDRVGLVWFSEDVNQRAILETTLAQGTGTAGYTTVKNEINALIAQGGTNIGHAINLARTELATNGRPGAVKVIVLMSDGVANNRTTGSACDTWPTVSNECTQDAINQANLAKAAGMTVFSIGFRLDAYSSNFTPAVSALAKSTLRDVASTQDTYFEATENVDIAPVFNRIAQLINDIVANNAVITEILGNGIHYIPGTGFPDPNSFVASPPPEQLTWNLGAITATGSATVTFNIRFDSGASNQLIEQYPSSVVGYDFNGQPITVPFPETYFSPTACLVPSPSPTLVPTPTPTVTPRPTATPTPSPSPTATPRPTPTPSPTPSPTPTLQCVNLKIFTPAGVEITNPGTITPGTTVRFAVLGSTSSAPTDIDMAQFRIWQNGVAGNWQQSLLTMTVGTSRYFYIEYTFPSGISSYRVDAQVHHSVTGAWE